MLLTSVGAPRTGDAWIHEAKLDDWRAIIEVSGGRVRMWSRTGREWTDSLPELVDLAILGDVVLDAEVVVATQGGRADFDLLGARMYGETDTPPACFYVFDVLRVGRSD